MSALLLRLAGPLAAFGTSAAFHDRDTFVGQKSTNGGSSDSAANDWQANPIGTSSCTVVMIVIPVQN